MSDFELQAGDVLYDHYDEERKTIEWIDSAAAQFEEDRWPIDRDCLDGRLEDGRFEPRPIRRDGGRPITDAKITGPHVEYAPVEPGGDDQETGHHYFRCEGCGLEAMRRRDVEYFCGCGGDQ